VNIHAHFAEKSVIQLNDNRVFFHPCQIIWFYFGVLSLGFMQEWYITNQTACHRLVAF